MGIVRLDLSDVVAGCGILPEIASKTRAVSRIVAMGLSATMRLIDTPCPGSAGSDDHTALQVLPTLAAV